MTAFGVCDRALLDDAHAYETAVTGRERSVCSRAIGMPERTFASVGSCVSERAAGYAGVTEHRTRSPCIPSRVTVMGPYSKPMVRPRRSMSKLGHGCSFGQSGSPECIVQLSSVLWVPEGKRRQLA